MPLTKFVRVALEGATSDGRTIERSWIEQMAANYNRAKYQARVWLEHMRGCLPDSSFRAFGDVLALKTEEVTLDGKTKLALLAQIDATDDMVTMVKARQKIFTSIEVNPKFADSGEAYLVGLAITDSPASLGTEMLQFNASSDSHPLNARKQQADNLFTEAAEAAIEFEDAEGTGLLASVKRLFSQDGGEQAGEDLKAIRTLLDSYQAQTAAALQLLAQHSEQMEQRMGQQAENAKGALQGFTDAVRELKDAVDARQQEFADTVEGMKQAIDEHNASTPADGYNARTPATGGTPDKDTEGF